MIVNTTTRSQTGPKIVGVRFALAVTGAIPLLLSSLVPIHRPVLFECPFLNLTGLPGPFCGFTRSIRAISAGEWVYATVNCPLAWLVYAALAGVFAWNAASILIGAKPIRCSMLQLNRVRANRAIGIVIALVVLNWIYRLSFGLT